MSTNSECKGMGRCVDCREWLKHDDAESKQVRDERIQKETVIRSIECGLVHMDITALRLLRDFLGCLKP